MPTPKASPPPISRGSTRSKSSTRSRAAKASTKSSGKRSTSRAPTPSATASRSAGGVADGLAAMAERIIRPLGIVMLTRDRIQETLDEAADRGRVTRSDANELVSELVRRGRQQTEELLSDIERVLGRGREQLGSATKRARLPEPVERLIRTADRARRTVGVGPSAPIAGYDDLLARQVQERLKGLTPAELRKVRDYELRHANRKSVLAAIERELASPA